MKKIIDYELISASAPCELNAEIKFKIKEGWQPFGNAYAFRDDNEDNEYLQTLVKYQEDEDERN